VSPRLRRFENKVVAVTGGATGIGKAAAERFCDEGAAVVVLDRHAIEGSGNSTITFLETDIRSAPAVKAAASSIRDLFGRLDVLCNNAGVELTRNLLDMSEEEWDTVMAVNVKGMFLVCRELLPLMMESGGGAVVNTSSISGIVGWPAYSAYCTSKGAVVLFTRQLALEMGPHNIRVNAVAPGTTRTRMIDRLLKDEDDVDAAVRLIQERHPLGRFAEPAEIAAAMLFLASPEASFITGALLPVDGGYTAK
jgi:NAD(P)-dependent dehydrogenase (short-subunit alcohol dehydrogenase family)